MFEVLYDLLYMMPIYMGAVISLNGLFEEPVNVWLLCFVVLVVSAFICTFINVKSKLKYITPGIIVLAAAAVVMLHAPEERSEFLLQNIWLLWTVLGGVLFTILGRLAGKVCIFRRVYGAVVLATLITLMVIHYDFGKGPLALLMIEIMIFVISEVQDTWVKSGDTDFKKHLVYVAPFLLVTGLILYKIPARAVPYDWKFAKVTWNKVTEIASDIKRVLPGSDESFAVTGFSETAKLGGIFEKAPKVMLEVTIPQTAGNGIYLKGKSFDSFTGREWVSTNSEVSHDNVMDLVETQCAIKQYDADYYKDYARVISLAVTYKKLRSRYLFVPLKAESYGDGDGRIETTEYQDAILATKRIRSDYEYKARYNRLNANHEAFAELARNLNPISEEMWNRTMNNIIHGDKAGYTYEDYKKWQQHNDELYLSEVSISPKLRVVLDEVYAGAESDFDKLKNLEAWLNGFKYTNAPGKLPDYIDTAEEFLDYFLLESREGYCVHYATAFTLLARAEGLPARFVQGCYVPRRDTVMTVTSDMAHAWPEVYIENLGWTMWEPSPGYKINTTWALTERDAKPTVTEIPEGFYDHEEEIEVKEEETKEPFNYMIIVIMFLLMLGFMVIFLAIYRMIVARDYARMSDGDKFRKLFWFNMAVLEMLGLKKAEQETLTEYHNRLLETLDENILCFIPTYERAIYAENIICNAQVSEITTCKNALISVLWTKKRKFRFWYRVKLCIIFALKSNS